MAKKAGKAKGGKKAAASKGPRDTQTFQLGKHKYTVTLEQKPLALPLHPDARGLMNFLLDLATQEGDVHKAFADDPDKTIDKRTDMSPETRQALKAKGPHKAFEALLNFNQQNTLLPIDFVAELAVKPPSASKGTSKKKR